MEKKKLLSIGLDLPNVVGVYRAKVAQLGFEGHTGAYDYNKGLQSLLRHVVRRSDGTVELAGNVSDIPRVDSEGNVLEVLPYEIYDEIVKDIAIPISERLGGDVIIDITCSRIIGNAGVFHVVDLLTSSSGYE